MADSSAPAERDASNLPEVWDCSDVEDEGGDNKLHQYPKNGSACQMDDPCFTDLTQIYGYLSFCMASYISDIKYGSYQINTQN